MSLLDYPISQPSLDISPFWTPVITGQLKKSYNSVQYRLIGKISVFMFVPYREFISLVMTSILRVL
jgi:hypothetical protein